MFFFLLSFRYWLDGSRLVELIFRVWNPCIRKLGISADEILVTCIQFASVSGIIYIIQSEEVFRTFYMTYKYSSQQCSISIVATYNFIIRSTTEYSFHMYSVRIKSQTNFTFENDYIHSFVLSNIKQDHGMDLRWIGMFGQWSWSEENVQSSKICCWNESDTRVCPQLVG